MPWLLPLIVATLLAAAPRPTPTARPSPPPGFERGVAPMLGRSCAGCHAPGKPGVRQLRLFDAQGRLLPEVLRADPDWIIETCASGHGKPRLSPAEVERLRRWRDAGMPP